MQAKRPFSPFGSSASLPGGGLQGLLSALQPPDWVVDEVQNRVVLFLNHVLMQEPQARDRLKRQQGRPVRLQWAGLHLTLAATPAGLVERAEPQASTDLVVTLTQSSPLDVARARWRDLVRDAHPDRAIARGLPPEAVRLAEARTRRLNEAWQTFRAMRVTDAG